MPFMLDTNVEIWLHILHSGKWWTSAQIDEHFKLRRGGSVRLLQDMASNCTLAKRHAEGALRTVEYAVTSACAVPRGVSVGRLQIHVEPTVTPETALSPLKEQLTGPAPIEFDFNNLTLRQINLLESQGWKPGDPRPQPPKASVRKLIERRLLEVHPVNIAGARVPAYVVPPLVQSAWRAARQAQAGH